MNFGFRSFPNTICCVIVFVVVFGVMPTMFASMHRAFQSSCRALKTAWVAFTSLQHY